MEDQPEVIGTFLNADIAILRNGKAKKNDPPIPADLAPISGAGKRKKKEEPEEDAGAVLDSIRFKYSEETIAEEVTHTEPEQPEQKPNAQRRKPRRSKSGNKPQAKAEGKPQPKDEGKPQNPQSKQAEETAPAAHKKTNRRYNHRLRRGGQSGEKKPQA